MHTTPHIIQHLHIIIILQNKIYLFYHSTIIALRAISKQSETSPSTHLHPYVVGVYKNASTKLTLP